MENQNENFPNQWNCSISQQLMTDPVIADDGFSYQRTSIEDWFKTSNMSPITGILLSTTKIIPNRALKQTIEQFLQKMKSQDQESKEQKRLESDIARMQEELKKKRYDLSQLVEQIDIIEQKLAENKRNLQKFSKKQEQKTKAEQERYIFITKLLEKTWKQFMKIDIEKHQKYGRFIDYECQEKMRLNMQSKSVTDQMVQEIVLFGLSRIKILQLSGNKITDHGFDLLFQNREWPVLQQIGLDQNKIQKIHSLHKIPNLSTLMILQNELSFASCSYMCEHQWPKLTELGISFKKGFNDKGNFFQRWFNLFKKGLNDKCWEMLLTVMPQKFPKLQLICLQLKGVISKENQQKLIKYCFWKQILLYG